MMSRQHQGHDKEPSRQQEEPPKVLCMGELLVDFVATQTNTALQNVTTFQAAPGGAPANVAVGVRRLGTSSGFFGKVGDDPFGTKLRNALDDAGVDTTYLLAAKAEGSRDGAANKEECQQKGCAEKKDGAAPQTTIVFGSVWDDGHKELCFYRGADRWLVPNDVASNMLQGIKCFHYGSITLLDEPAASAQKKAIQIARKEGLMLTYDPNYRPTLAPNEAIAHNVIMEGYRYAHLAKISLEEWSVATGHDDMQKGIQAVLEQGVELLVISRGEQGALATNGDYTIESRALSNLDIVETTGAGDGFMAAMIVQLLPQFYKHGGSLKTIDKSTVQDALDYANVVGGLACTKAGAIPALPSAQQVNQFLASSCHEMPNEQRPLITSAKQLATMIDQSCLKPFCTSPNDIEKLCREARQYEFCMVAVNPAQVEKSCQLLKGSHVKVGAAIGFPLGQSTCATKLFEARDAIQRGAMEIDMVLNVRLLQEGNLDAVKQEVQGVVKICHASNVICKIILETCNLTDEQKVQACQICRDAGVDYVKTSTGFAAGGATVQDIKLMRETVGPSIGVKASGGIRDLKTVREMVAAGATRIGTSSGVAIMEEWLAEQTSEQRIQQCENE